MSTSTASIEDLAINTIRTLSMDAVQRANSGHPGTPMALAPVAYVLFNEFLKYDPAAPQWPARDRFVLSCGHASMLLYSLLHVAGVRSMGAEEPPPLAITLEDIRNFRQLGSSCAGHPEFGDAAGIETTTGPLGQGIGNSVGMAIAAEWLAARYNRPGHELLGNDVYALCSDGDIMEGVGGEAASLAGHLKLSNLCWIYDDNHITIEGHTKLAFSEEVGPRFTALGWHVVQVDDANDLASIRAALGSFQETRDRPTLIILRSVIAWGAPHKANTHGAHGAPLGEDEIRLTKQVYGWPEDRQFWVPDEVREHFAAGIGHRGGAARQEWQTQFSSYEAEYPDLADQLQHIWQQRLPSGWQEGITGFSTDDNLATRVSSGKVLNAVAARVPWLLGGSADLGPSTKTLLDGDRDFAAADHGGRNFHFGIREHAMAAAANGMALCGLRPYVSTFFIFCDYLRPSMRLSAIMHLPVLYIFTHDSIGLGEDGPTHQPVEQLAACRAIPRLVVIRPADANEVAESYRVALETTDRPVALVLSRQNIATLCRERYAAASGLAHGGYILAEADGGPPDVILIGSGSEVALCVDAYEQLSAAGIRARVVSMPSWELFEAQDVTYRERVLPPSVGARVAVEAGISQGWEKFIGPCGQFVGLSDFGASAPYEQLYEHLGISVARIISIAKRLTAG